MSIREGNPNALLTSSREEENQVTTQMQRAGTHICEIDTFTKHVA